MGITEQPCYFVCLSPSSLDRDLTFRREDEQFRELKIELQ